VKKSSLFPNLFSKNVAGLDVSDQSIKYVTLVPVEGGFGIELHGIVQLPEGVIREGVIEDPKKLSTILAQIKSRTGITHVRTSLPESHHFIVEQAGMEVKGAEIRARALARALISPGDPDALMLVNFGENQTDISVSHRGQILSTQSLPMPDNLTLNLARALAIPLQQAHELKQTTGISRRDEDQEMFKALFQEINQLKKLIHTTFVNWHVETPGEYKKPAIREIILSGSNAHVRGLTEYLSSALHVPVTKGNPWQNINMLENYVPTIHERDIAAYAVAMGLVMGELK
jgi:Tfp pilus assembly PilM family ATPase